jgi:hypothetical protein
MYNGQRRRMIAIVIENEQRIEKKSSSSKWTKYKEDEYQ